MSRKVRVDKLKPGDVFVDGTNERYYVYVGPSEDDKDSSEAFDLQDNFVDATWGRSTLVEKVKAKFVVSK